LAPYFQPLQLASTSFAIRTDTKKNAGSRNAKEKSKDSRPVIDSTTNLLNEGSLLTLRH